ncbi:Hypothetical Protein FCC1311_013052 [Hondaea fermentalgiana]|uniref:Uncharacterized protein n=1 Tax=Hondaea fermentalgiana TaxID=2315210 RepID=A0A2R5G5N7_9STRA|nr:Hypothetical Protein FCC1311_013052 [Hondaea fermentalgiana]|eukprot:GBG25088.1 Hypothetical Protein FCC1311_013052 [Hondaea fermentalgiana]
MALFDIASMGKDMVNAARKKSSREKGLESGDHDDAEQAKHAREQQAALDELTDAENAFMSAADADTDTDGGVEDAETGDEDNANDDDEDDDVKSTQSGRSSRSLGKTLIRKMYSSRKKSFRERKNSSESVRSAKSAPRRTKTAATFEPISMELSNSLALSAQSAGYGPAFRLLKTMNRIDRETIMDMLLIRRTGVSFNDETDAHDIIFKKLFGIRSRTNTALRAVRVLSQSTWIHTLLKVATALNLSAKMILSSGDWRIPTRLTTGISNRAAKRAADADFLAGESPVLDKAEQKFYSKLQRNIEARLGANAVMLIRAIVYEQAGPELRGVVFGEDVSKSDAVEPIDELDALQQPERRKDTMDTDDTIGSTSEAVAVGDHIDFHLHQDQDQVRTDDDDDDDHHGENEDDDEPLAPAISMNLSETAHAKGASHAAGLELDELAMADKEDADADDAQSAGTSNASKTAPEPARGKKKMVAKKRSKLSLLSPKCRAKSKRDFKAELEAGTVGAAEEDEELFQLKESFQIPSIITNIEKVKPGFGKYVLLLLEVFALRAKVRDEDFVYADKKDMIKKMAVVGAKDGIIGLSLGIPLATFVNPFLGFPLMTMSFINLSMGSTEFNIIEPVCMIQLHQLFLAANGTSIYDL